MASDPTITSLQQFSDPHWVVVKNVPVFREHTAQAPDGNGPDGKPKFRPMPIDRRELSLFTRELQRLEQDEGVLARLTLGHTLGKGPHGEEPKESEQPPIVGYARNAHDGFFGPKSKPATLVDFWYRRDDWDKAKQYPYRSPEVYLNARQITGVALLKRDPKLDMGMTIYQHGHAPAASIHEPKSYYERGDGCNV